MGFFNHSQRLVPEDAPTTVSPVEEFIISHQDALTASMSYDDQAGSFVQDIRAGEIGVQIGKDIARALHDSGHRYTEGATAQIANTFLNNLTYYWITAATYTARHNHGIISKASQVNGMQVMPSQSANIILGGIDKNKRKFINDKLIELTVGIEQAESAADFLVSAMAKEFFEGTSKARQLIEVENNDDAIAEDPQYGELRSVLRLDWHRSTPQDSVLRKQLNKLGDKPAAFLDLFAEHVALQGDQSRYAQIRQVAALVLSFANFATDSQSIQNFITHNRALWAQNEQINQAFEGFITSEVVAIRAIAEEIVGTSNFRSFRKHLNEDDIARIKAGVDLWQPLPPRSQRTKVQRSQGVKLARNAAKELEVDIEQSAQSATPEPRRLAALRNGSLMIFDSPEDAAAFFAGNGSNQYGKTVQDFATMAHFLAGMRSYISAGTLRLNDVSIRYDNKNLPLRRLAPDKVPNLRVNDRFLRTVFAIAGDTVIIHDMLTHEAFTKKYS